MAQTLYAALGGPASTSDLYTVDPSDASLTPIGPIGFAVTGLAFDPTSGFLYGVTSNNSGSSPRSLISVDPTTGAGSLIGPLGLPGGLQSDVSDLAFDSSGQLFGWSTLNFTHGLVSINKATGAGTFFPGAYRAGGALDFDSVGVLWHIDAAQINTVDPTTGVQTATGVAPDRFPSCGKFDEFGVMWISDSSHLYTADLGTGVMTDMGSFGVTNLDALAWGLAALAPFSLNATPTTITLGDGDSGDVTINSTMHTGPPVNITLSASGQPAGVSVSFTPNPISDDGGTSTMHIAVGATVPGATYPIIVTGDDGAGNTATVTVLLMVPVANSDCSGATALEIVGCPTGSITLNTDDFPYISPTPNPDPLWSYNGSDTISYGPFVVPQGIGFVLINADSRLDFNSDAQAVTPGDTVTLTLDVSTVAGAGVSFGANVEFQSSPEDGYDDWPASAKFTFGDTSVFVGDPLMQFDESFCAYVAWFKFTNQSATDTYLLLDVTCITAPNCLNVAAMVAPGTCDAIDYRKLGGGDAWGYDGHFFNGNTDQEGWFLRLCNGESISGESFGSHVAWRVAPGEAVFFIVGMEDDFTTRRIHGTYRVDWQSFDFDTYDITDTRRPIQSGTPFVGESDAVPTHGTLDVSRFSTPTGGETGGIGNPNGYIFFNGHHFITGSGTIGNITGPGTCSSIGASANQDELGVWELDADGNEVAFNIIGTFVNAIETGSPAVFDDAGNQLIVDPGTHHFCTDGTNLWLVVPVRLVEDNPYDGSIPPHKWDPMCAGVYHYNGSSFDFIGNLPAITSNIQNASAIFGPNNGGMLVVDACASPEEPGVLRVIQSEAGILRISDASLPCSSIFDPDYGPWGRTIPPGNNVWARAVSCGEFSAGGLVSQTILKYDERGILSPYPFVQLGVQESFTGAAWIRNDDGHPIWAWIVPLTGETASPGYQFAIEIYDLASNTVLTTIDHTFIDPILDDQGVHPTQMSGGFLSHNAMVDPFDDRRCYLMALTLISGGATQVVFRIDTADMSAQYIDDSPHSSWGSNILVGSLGDSASGYAYFDEHGIWVPGGATNSEFVNHYIRCITEWRGDSLSWGDTIFDNPRYPGLGYGSFDAMLLDDDSFWSAGLINAPPFVQPTNFALIRGHVLRDWVICSTGELHPCLSEGLHIWKRVRLG